ncbi:MAG TPA: nuclear transport factor 2 family protein [Solirubrobacterales bacterium]|nr:nuclear transport factor 2 family protein [Solirubrobacterales bacterium]
MSQENVEVFKRAFDAINRRDGEALLSELDPEVEWHGAILMAMGGEQTVYRGHDGVREWLRDLYETLSEFQAKYPDIRDLGDRTVAIGHVRGRGTASEVEIQTRHATVVEFKNGKGFRIRTYLDPEEAVEAVGLAD